MQYPNLIFDLDGTIADPSESILAAIRYALRKLGVDVPAEKELRTCIGPPIETSFAECFGLSERQAREALVHYRRHLSQEGMNSSDFYDGIPELLRSLVNHGGKLFLISSKPLAYAQPILDHLRISGYFTGVYSSEGVASKGLLVQLIMEDHHLDRQKTVVIGDREQDIIAARDNGVDSIAVGYGYGNAVELITAAPTLYCKTLMELESALAIIF